MAAQARSVKVWLALVTVYVVWGSTYLAIRYAIGADTGERGLPPLAMASIRFVLAGALMFAWAVRRPAPGGGPDPLGWRQWRATAIAGCALLLGGNGFVVLAEQRVESYIVAVLIAMVPVWAAVLGLTLRGERLRPAGTVGLGLGFAGVVLLVNPFGATHVDLGGSSIVVLASLCWTGGSYYSQRAPMPRRPLVMTAMEMLCGGAGLGLFALVTGDWGRLDLGAVGPMAWWAFAYLLLFGSLLAFTAYVWLLRNASLSLVTTYAYVNPVVAVILGAVLLSEKVTTRTLTGSAVIVAGVALIVSTRAGSPPAGPPESPLTVAGADPTARTGNP